MFFALTPSISVSMKEQYSPSSGKTAAESIRLLSDQLISQIAAGEVIERPAAVVKELLENAIDAGATRIDIRLQNGGKKRITVTDNGSGISPDELGLALVRHATSKIASLHDLENVLTLGFRGEALASIASVADVDIISRTPDGAHAWTISGSDASGEPVPASALQGTTVDVRELYINTPARRKFLKSDQTEYGQCLDVIRRIALARPEIHFSLYHNEKSSLQWAQGTLEERSAGILSDDFVSARFYLDRTTELGGLPMRLYGFLGLSTALRSRADLQYFYVNGRFVRDRVLSHAVRAAYEDILYGNNHPAYVLFIEIPPTHVDVNVHPAKTEVRFRDSRLVHQFVQHSVQSALADPAGEAEPKLTDIPSTDRSALPAHSPLFSHPRRTGMNWRDLPELGNFGMIRSDGVSSESLSLPHTGMAATDGSDPENPLGYAIAQLKDLFILAQNERGLILVDMHAAHERILYEKYKNDLDEKAVQTQALLIPIVFRADPVQTGTAETHREDLLSMGFDISSLSPDTLSIRSFPGLLIDTDVESTVKDMLAELHEVGVSVISAEKRNEFLARIACHRAVRANRRLTVLEMNALLRQIEVTKNADVCSHGRPTWIQLDWSALDAFFRRGR